MNMPKRASIHHCIFSVAAVVATAADGTAVAAGSPFGASARATPVPAAASDSTAYVIFLFRVFMVIFVPSFFFT